MGQRLNIEVKIGNVVTNCYYHWSGFSTTSLELVKEIIEGFKKDDINYSESTIISRMKTAIELLLKSGASIPKQHLETAKTITGIEKFPTCNRNEGIISIFPEEFSETRYWEEGRVTIDCLREKIDFNCMCNEEETRENYYYQDENNFLDENIDYVPKYEGDLKEVPFKEIDTLLQVIQIAEDNFEGIFKDNNGIYSSIGG